MSKPGPTPTEEQRRAAHEIQGPGCEAIRSMFRLGPDRHSPQCTEIARAFATREAAAELRGRIAGLREAYEMAIELETCFVCNAEFVPPDRPYCEDEHILEDVNDGRPKNEHVYDRINARVSALESTNAQHETETK